MYLLLSSIFQQRGSPGYAQNTGSHGKKAPEGT